LRVAEGQALQISDAATDKTWDFENPQPPNHPEEFEKLVHGA
jgi:hypothetical protein